MKSFLKYYAVIMLFALILTHPEETVYYARSGMELCGEIIIPALFPFFVCSGLMMYSGLCGALEQAAEGIMRPLFKVGGSGAAAFVLGVISGYPLGAVTACELYNNGHVTKIEAERLLAFTNNSGPLFILGSVGAALYHSPKAGAILYSAHLTAAVLVGILFRFYKTNACIAPLSERISKKTMPLGEAFPEVLKKAVDSTLTIMGAVIFFAIVSNILADLFAGNSVVRGIILSISEISGGVKYISMLPVSVHTKLILSAAACGFAGICIHLQVLSVTAGSGLSLKPYIVGKLLHSVLAAVFTAWLLKLFPITQTVFAGTADIGGAAFTVRHFRLHVRVWYCCLRG